MLKPILTLILLIITTLVSAQTQHDTIDVAILGDSNIILLTPMQTTAVRNSDIEEIGELIDYCGKQLNISVISQDKICSVKSADERVKKVNTYDGTHISQTGAQKNGKIIALEISNLLTQNQE